MEDIIIKMEIIMKENGKIIKEMEKEWNIIKKDKQNLM